MIIHKYASINGITMYYEIHGEGEPLVLLHGGGSTIETTFGNVLPSLAEHYKIIAVELQAHGRTSDRDAPVTFSQDASDVVALLRHLAIPKANIFGFSNGGTTALQIAISYPDVVSKLVIASAIYKRQGMIAGFFDMMQHALLHDMPQPLQQAFLKYKPDKNALQNMHDKDKNRMLHFEDWNDDDLRSIQAPALVISGDKDVVLPEHTLHISRLIKQSELMILPGTHGSFIGEVCSNVPGSSVPRLTAIVIHEFLKRQSNNIN